MVCVDYTSEEKLLHVSEYCHAHDPAIVFIKADIRGLFCSVFSDFGPKHVIYDKTGEEPRQAIITSISNVRTIARLCVSNGSFSLNDCMLTRLLLSRVYRATLL